MVQAALIAAMYVVLTWVANLLRLANGVIQVRFSEALTILPFLHQQQFQDFLLAASSVTPSPDLQSGIFCLAHLPH